MENTSSSIKTFLGRNKYWLLFFASATVVIIAICSANYQNTKYIGRWFCDEEYSYINSELACTRKDVISKVSYQVLEEKLKNYVNAKIAKGELLDAGIYFRDLKEGPVFGINENKDFISASLIKLPVVMTMLRLAEQDPGVLKQKVLYEKNIPNDNQDFMPQEKMEVGQSYTVDNLIDRTLIYSDNASNELLIGELRRMSPRQDLIEMMFYDLGWVLPQRVIDEDMSPRRFSSLLRLLYNASFLSKDMSEKILHSLSQSTFDQGIAGGVPPEIVVANKFGERQLDYTGDSNQLVENINELHDCGIVYYPENPYLLCIMTKGRNFDQLSSIITSISKMIYEEVNARRL